MKTRMVSPLLISCAIGIAVAVSGCCVCWGWRGQESFERSEQVSASMQGVEQIKVDTSFGDVKINGADTTDCNVTARIKGQAPTEDEARQLAEQTKITLVVQDKTLIIKADKPHLRKNRSIGIDYDIVIPTKTGIDCKTSFGDVELKNIKGDVAAHTSFGDIGIENMAGKMQLNTSYGDVKCSRITSGEFNANTSFGDVDIFFADDCPPDLSAKIATSYGDLKVDTPSAFAGNIVVETSFGKIKTDLPITVRGDFGKNRLTGKIGDGAGKLDLKTSFGNVTIK